MRCAKEVRKIETITRERYTKVNKLTRRRRRKTAGCLKSKNGDILREYLKIKQEKLEQLTLQQ